MTTRTEKNIRSLTKVSGGSSYGVTIPIEYIRKLKWKTKQKLEVTLYQDRIIIRDWKAK
jgi:bifunctional DNA-binding transcriptional regulator/antitoxin component of YhaV-PrlF toxin-antitoxin module